MQRKPPPTPIKRLKRLLTSGNLWLYILSLIKSRGKLYAYELDGEIEESFSFKPDKIVIYVVLYRLEAEGLIRPSVKERRKYYSLTAAGADTLGQARTYFRMLARRL